MFFVDPAQGYYIFRQYMYTLNVIWLNNSFVQKIQMKTTKNISNLITEAFEWRTAI